MTTGSLGQGTSAAAGIATGFKMNKTDQYVYLIVGDGELNEGQCWEAFQYIAHYKLNHCVVIIDDNKKQLDGTTKEVMNPFSIENKMKAFGFYTQTVKGNDEEAIDEAINRAKNVKDQAVCIILDSIKGSKEAKRAKNDQNSKKGHRIVMLDTSFCRDERMPLGWSTGRADFRCISGGCF